jgi:hypothetical protein
MSVEIPVLGPVTLVADDVDIVLGTMRSSIASIGVHRSRRASTERGARRESRRF